MAYLQDLIDQMLAKITRVAESATEDERQKVAELRRKDRAAQVETHLITPPMAGLLFLDGFDRDWDPEWCFTLAHVMSLDRWRPDSPGYVLYADGSLADGRHRLGAQAYSETTLSVAIYFRDDQLR